MLLVRDQPVFPGPILTKNRKVAIVDYPLKPHQTFVFLAAGSHHSTAALGYGVPGAPFPEAIVLQ